MLTRRSRAREVALQLLFQKDRNPTAVPRDAIERFARDRLSDSDELTRYCLTLYDGVVAHQAEIDPQLAAAAENWRLARVFPVDRNVLRLGAFELLYDPNGQPLEVVIDEAIELARRFGTVESSSFVNGILDKLAKQRTANNAGISESTGEAAEPEQPPSPSPTPLPEDTVSHLDDGGRPPVIPA